MNTNRCYGSPSPPHLTELTSSDEEDSETSSLKGSKNSYRQGHGPYNGAKNIYSSDDTNDEHYHEVSDSVVSRDEIIDQYADVPWYLNRNWKKCLVSFILWFTSYEIMAVFGGSVAFLHFPRFNEDFPVVLPDYGYDLIPEFCPSIRLMPLIKKDNIQSEVLMFLYLYILFYCFVRREGALIFQQLLHLNICVFLTRTSTVGVTSMPQPNSRCVAVQHQVVTYWESIKFVMGRGFPPHACGDLLYSGHVSCLLVCLIVIYRHKLYWNTRVRALLTMLTAVGTYFVISCRSHYTVDVVLAFYFTFAINYVYYTQRSNNMRIIKMLECSYDKDTSWSTFERMNRIRKVLSGSWTTCTETVSDYYDSGTSSSDEDNVNDNVSYQTAYDGRCCAGGNESYISSISTSTGGGDDGSTSNNSSLLGYCYLNDV